MSVRINDRRGLFFEEANLVAIRLKRGAFTVFDTKTMVNSLFMILLISIIMTWKLKILLVVVMRVIAIPSPSVITFCAVPRLNSKGVISSFIFTLMRIT